VKTLVVPEGGELPPEPADESTASGEDEADVGLPETYPVEGEPASGV
jgi:hypothetical protein